MKAQDIKNVLALFKLAKFDGVQGNQFLYASVSISKLLEYAEKLEKEELEAKEMEKLPSENVD